MWGDEVEVKIKVRLSNLWDLLNFYHIPDKCIIGT